MFCINCGNKISKGAKFCAKCGSSISNETLSNNDVQPAVENETPSLAKKEPNKILKYFSLILFLLAFSIIRSASSNGASGLIQDLLNTISNVTLIGMIIMALINGRNGKRWFTNRSAYFLIIFSLISILLIGL